MSRLTKRLGGGRRPRARKMENKKAGKGKGQRGGQSRNNGGPIPDAKAYTLEGIVFENVEKGSTVSTDQWKGYGELKGDYVHGTVEHGAKEYVRGIHHVNTLESHWSLFQRAVKGTHVHISAK